MKSKVVTFSVDEDLYRKFSSLVKGEGRNYSEVISDEIRNCLGERKVFSGTDKDKRDILRAVHIPKDLWEKYSIFLIKEGRTKADQIRGIIEEYVRGNENVVLGEDTAY